MKDWKAFAGIVDDINVNGFKWQDDGHKMLGLIELIYRYRAPQTTPDQLQDWLQDSLLFLNNICGWQANPGMIAGYVMLWLKDKQLPFRPDMVRTSGI